MSEALPQLLTDVGVGVLSLFILYRMLMALTRMNDARADADKRADMTLDRVLNMFTTLDTTLRTMQAAEEAAKSKIADSIQAQTKQVDLFTQAMDRICATQRAQTDQLEAISAGITTLQLRGTNPVQALVKTADEILKLAQVMQSDVQKLPDTITMQIGALNREVLDLKRLLLDVREKAQDGQVMILTPETAPVQPGVRREGD